VRRGGSAEVMSPGCVFLRAGARGLRELAYNLRWLGIMTPLNCFPAARQRAVGIPPAISRIDVGFDSPRTELDARRGIVMLLRLSTVT